MGDQNEARISAMVASLAEEIARVLDPLLGAGDGQIMGFRMIVAMGTPDGLCRPIEVGLSINQVVEDMLADREFRDAPKGGQKDPVRGFQERRKGKRK